MIRAPARAIMTEMRRVDDSTFTRQTHGTFVPMLTARSGAAG